jgi:hypothetical protein
MKEVLIGKCGVGIERRDIKTEGYRGEGEGVTIYDDEYWMNEVQFISMI